MSGWESVSPWFILAPNLGDIALNSFLLPRLFPDLGSKQKRVERVLLGAGSILGFFNAGCVGDLAALPVLIFGSGYQYGELPEFAADSRVFALRGPVTCRALGEDERLGVGDPAILLPGYLPRAGRPLHRRARVLRYDAEPPASRDTFTCRVDATGLPAWLEKLWQYREIETEALHVAILADAYGVPWKPLRWEMKWEDHFATVGIHERPRGFVLSDRRLLAQRVAEMGEAARRLDAYVRRQPAGCG